MFLIEQGTIGAEEAELDQAASVGVHTAHVEWLTLSLNICIVTTLHSTVTGETSLGNVSINWIILGN